MHRKLLLSLFLLIAVTCLLWANVTTFSNTLLGWNRLMTQMDLVDGHTRGLSSSSSNVRLAEGANEQEGGYANTRTNTVLQDNTPLSSSSSSHPPKNQRRLLTVGEIKQRMVLPCNYVHDGFYIADSNEILSQMHQSIWNHSLMDDDMIPIVVEVGGHDGITKSLTLKASRCLAVNTLLIEASPTNYRVLEQARGSYDWTVHGALCDDTSSSSVIEIVENEINSGQTHVLRGPREAQRLRRGGTTTTTSTVPCTTVDAEIDRLREQLPIEQQSKLQLIMLVLDVEGFEAKAIHGIQKYSPQKVFMEEKHLKARDRQVIADWAQSHRLVGRKCNKQDSCYNFDSLLAERPAEEVKTLLYGARWAPPKHTFKTKEASQSYMFYDE